MDKSIFLFVRKFSGHPFLFDQKEGVHSIFLIASDMSTDSPMGSEFSVLFSGVSFHIMKDSIITFFLFYLFPSFC